MDKPLKPLGRKAYGSIPHLVGSRRGPGDRGVSPEQHALCCERVRDRHDHIVVQEKLDGGCVAVAKVGGRIYALGRAGYPAETSPYEQHHIFAEWVEQEARAFDALLNEGERVVGEWIAQAHGTRYACDRAPFIAFDIMQDGARETTGEVEYRCGSLDIATAHTIHSGNAALSIGEAMSRLGDRGHHGALDGVEGAVWRLERKGKVLFLAKYVRPEKQDGCYLPEISGGEPVWNWRPSWREGI